MTDAVHSSKAVADVRAAAEALLSVLSMATIVREESLRRAALLAEVAEQVRGTLFHAVIDEAAGIAIDLKEGEVSLEYVHGEVKAYMRLLDVAEGGDDV